MAHRISISNGKAEFAYTGEQPWHGLGESVPEHMTPHEAVQRVIPWTVSSRPVAYPVVEGGAFDHVAEGVRVVVRDDTHTHLGVATEAYQPIQNTQAGDVADALVAEGAKCVETIGALDDGARCFMLLTLDKSGFEVRAGDVVLPYFLLRWGHDGKTTLAGKLTNIRVVCHNTLTAAGKTYAFDVKHNGRAKVRVAEAREALGIARKAYAHTREEYKALARTDITSEQATGYFREVLPISEEEILRKLMTTLTAEEIQKLERWEAVQDRLLDLYESGQGAAPGTAWGAYNAVTEYLDHVYPVLQSGKVSVQRQQSVLFGAYADVRDAAYRQAVTLMK